VLLAAGACPVAQSEQVRTRNGGTIELLGLRPNDVVVSVPSVRFW